MNKSSVQGAPFPIASQENISQRARELWEGYGRPTGRDAEIWLEAERQLLGVDPLVEGREGIAVSAAQFDESTRQNKPRSRMKKTAPLEPTSAPAKSAKATPRPTPARNTAAAAKPERSTKTKR